MAELAITALLSSLSAGCNLRYNVFGSENSAGAAGATGGLAGVGGGGGAPSGGHSGMEAAGVMAVGGMAGGAGAVGGMGGASGSAGTGRVEDFSWACIHGGRCEQLPVNPRDKLDILFIIDDSASMLEEQALLRSEFPSFIAALTSGDRNGDGIREFRPIESLQLGVVSTDLGLSGITDVPNCVGLGDDGILQNSSSPEVMGCSQSSFSPRFLIYEATPDTVPTQLPIDLQCVSALGDQGCGFEQQLEAGLKALWPADDERVLFLADPSGFGSQGQGGSEGTNSGFLRPDSVLAIVLLTDEDDCSSLDTSHFRLNDPTLLPTDARHTQGLNVRCHYEDQRAEPNNIYDTSRYINAFKALRSRHEEDVVFAAITGVPLELVGPGPGSFDLDAYYNNILASPEMQEVVDDQGTTDIADDKLVPVCDTSNGKVYPARRITEVVQGFGDNGVLGSICESDFGPTIRRITEKVSSRFGNQCLSEPISHNGETINCEVIWELPLPENAPPGVPSDCGGPGFGFLSPTMRLTPNGEAVCSVTELGVDAMSGGVLSAGEGFYYDDFSAETERACVGSGARIAFTELAQPPFGVNVYLDCPGPLVTE